MKRVIALLAMAAMAGCSTTGPVIQLDTVDRFHKAPAPGETMDIPELLAPALQWFLVDDVWLIQQYGVEVE